MNYKPTRILELGTGDGTLTAYFSMYAKLAGFPVEILSVDIDAKRNQIKCDNVRYAALDLKKDLFPSDLTVYGFINRPGDRIYCLVDAWDPKSELANVIIPQLPAGTIISIHDFISPMCKKPFHWGWRETDLTWGIIDKYEPNYTLSLAMDARMCWVKRK